jgi:hypothetical protein
VEWINGNKYLNNCKPSTLLKEGIMSYDEYYFENLADQMASLDAQHLDEAKEIIALIDACLDRELEDWANAQDD